jgi:hypothetical protein
MAHAGRSASPEDYDRALQMLGDGATLDQAESELISSGLSAEAAKEVVQELLIRSLYGEAVDMLQSGQLPQQVERYLRDERGLTPETAKTIVENARNMKPEDVAFQSPASSGPGNPALMVLGGIIFGLGVILFIGNISGAFVPFPCAGWLTIVIGGAIYGAGKKS